MKDFMTQETRNAIHEVARNRSKNRIIEISNELYVSLKHDIIDAGTYEGEYITATVERMIGKTCALIRLANEYKVPIIVPNDNIKCLVERQAKELNKNVEAIVINRRNSSTHMEFRKKYRVVLTEERVDIGLVKEIFRPLGIVGIN